MSIVISALFSGIFSLALIRLWRLYFADAPFSPCQSICLDETPTPATADTRNLPKYKAGPNAASLLKGLHWIGSMKFMQYTRRSVYCTEYEEAVFPMPLHFPVPCWSLILHRVPRRFQAVCAHLKDQIVVFLSVAQMTRDLIFHVIRSCVQIRIYCRALVHSSLYIRL